jgi:hypothetical protein
MTILAIAATLACSDSPTAVEHEAAGISSTTGAVVTRVPSPAVLSTDVVGVPITDLGEFTYKGFSGGLYPEGSSTMPAEHASVGVHRGRAVRPRLADGTPSATGRYVLLSIGMSNTSNEFCGRDKTSNCDTTSFKRLANADPSVNHSALVIVNGAQGGQDAGAWDAPFGSAYDVVRDYRLRPMRVAERQVAVIWIKQADAEPSVPLPSLDADAYLLEKRLGGIVRSLKVRYPNLKQVFISSRIFAGYATVTLNPEPYAYEGGFAVKWIIGAQINQMRDGRVVDLHAGNLDYTTAAPWIAWGPYLWANGTSPRSDGLTWERSDFLADGTHPSPSGTRKVATALLHFFKGSPQTQCWFVVGGICQ